MSLFLVARRYLLSRPAPTLLTVTSVALGVGLFVAVINLASGVKSGLLRMSSVYELVIGAKGSPTQLVLSALFFLDVPTGNIPHALYLRLAADPRVAGVVPINGGDSYRGFRIIGTTREYFTRPPTDRATAFRLAGGRLFERNFEAVIGAEVARRTGLAPGATFVGVHGATADPAVSEPDPAHRKEPYTVVGILERTNTPVDHAIFTTLETVWEIHGLVATARAGGGPAAEVTALLVRPRNFMAALAIHTQTNGGREAQAVFPPQVIARLLEIFGTGERVLEIIAFTVIAIGTLAVMVSMMTATLERQREIATMRALGARPRAILALVLLQGALLSALGALAGVLAGRAVAYAAGIVLRQSTGVAPVLAAPQTLELVAPAATILLGTLAAVVPAITAYRTDVADNLYPLR